MFYTDNPLDRQDHLRTEASKLTEFWSLPSTCVIPIWQGKVLVDKSEDRFRAVRLDSKSLGQNLRHKTFLGKEVSGLNVQSAEPVYWFSIEIVSDEAPDIATLVTNSQYEASNCEFADMRTVGPLLDADDGANLIYAKAINVWQSRSKYCSNCGSPAELGNGGHVRVCSNTECATHHFPRTDPAVIMLVVDADNTDRCLLGRNPNWPDGVFSTLAGFVEAGESLEAAVAREVCEETGIEVRDVAYVASQPWPFPRSIMLGFQALATTTTLKINHQELEDARWFTRREIREFGEWGEESDKFKLPRQDSIARSLIEMWMNKG